MTTLIEQLISKMGLHDEPGVEAKTTELVRLLELRSTNVPLQVNDYGKIVLCIDLAAADLGFAFDKEQALKLSGLRKSHYTNHKRMFEKLLDINKLVGVKDICIQLNLNEISAKAEELLALYKKVLTANGNASEIDLTHPQYAAMAVFQASKLLKQKSAKAKFMPFSHLRPTQWLQLEQRWDKFIAQHYKNTMDNKLKKQDSNEENKPNAETNANVGAKPKAKAVETYEDWRSRMLEMAEMELKAQKLEKQMEKENRA